MNLDFPILRVVTKILVPYILLFAFYVQFHGEFSPSACVKRSSIATPAESREAHFSSTQNRPDPPRHEVLPQFGRLSSGVLRDHLTWVPLPLPPSP